jgi:hypothetical protein
MNGWSAMNYCACSSGKPEVDPESFTDQALRWNIVFDPTALVTLVTFSAFAPDGAIPLKAQFREVQQIAAVSLNSAARPRGSRHLLSPCQPALFCAPATTLFAASRRRFARSDAG